MYGAYLLREVGILNYQRLSFSVASCVVEPLQSVPSRMKLVPLLHRSWSLMALVDFAENFPTLSAVVQKKRWPVYVDPKTAGGWRLVCKWQGNWPEILMRI